MIQNLPRSGGSVWQAKSPAGSARRTLPNGWWHSCKTSGRRWIHVPTGSGCDMAELTQNEKRLLAILEKEKEAEAPRLASLLGATPEAVVQWAHLAKEKGLVTTERIVARQLNYTDEGRGYLEKGLPETQLLLAIQP